MANNVSFFITADSEVDFTKEFKMQSYTRTFADDSWEVIEAVELENQPFMKNLGQKWSLDDDGDSWLENSYDWYCENVGAKWCNIEEVDETQVYGYSAWSPPTEMLGHLAAHMKANLRMNYEDEFRNFVGVAFANETGNTSFEEIDGNEFVERLCEELDIDELPNDFEWFEEYEDSGIVPQEWLDDAVHNWFDEQ